MLELGVGLLIVLPWYFVKVVSTHFFLFRCVVIALRFLYDELICHFHEYFHASI